MSAVLFSVIMSVSLSFVPPFFEIIFLGSFGLFVGLTARVKLPIMATAVIISTGISLSIEIVASMFLLIPSLIYIAIFSVEVLYAPTAAALELALPQAVVFAISIVLVFLLFRIKRLRKGLVFLGNKYARSAGILLSLLIMFSRSIIAGETVYASIAVVTVISLWAVGLHFWWRYQTTKLYRQRLEERDNRQLILEIEEKDKQIKHLSESNEFLSKVLHKDNKLIPAMYNAVNIFLNSAKIDAETRAKGINILTDLSDIIHERKEMMVEIQGTHKPMPSTDIERVDNIINYMYLRAAEKEIQFDFLITGSIKDIIERAITKLKLETLLADLIENAIIATSHSEHKKIRVTMSVVDGYFEINIEDSGIPFEAKTLADLGTKKTTTHADTGGSGIGYLTIFEILGESGASLILTEYVPENYAFTKSVKVRFDRKSEYAVYAFEANEYRLVAKRQVTDD
jgi:signal transduction histidine kinase